MVINRFGIFYQFSYNVQEFMLKNDTLKSGTSRIGLYGSAPLGARFTHIFFSIILDESVVSQRFIVDCYISLYHIILLPLLTYLGFAWKILTFINYFCLIFINPISTGGGVFHPIPSKWVRTPQRNKIAPWNLVTFQNWVLAKFSIL